MSDCRRPGSPERDRAAARRVGEVRRQPGMNLDDPGILRSGEPVRDARTAWRAWLASPPGRYVLDWEQAQFDAAVADLFGFHAMQCGLPEIDALRDNRMPHRIHACEPGDLVAQNTAHLVLDRFEELPIGSQTLDLVVLPHVLEFASDPHRVLREIDRVLRPEGRVILSGFNPVSLWGARQGIGRAIGRSPFLPVEAQFIGLPRLRDWFKLLSFEAERGRYGCYRPPCRTQRWLDRTRFMEAAGDRWWPICGATYVVTAIKRTWGMRLVGPAWRTQRAGRRAVAVVTPHCRSRER